jgi:hypothetical protein
LLGQPGAKYLHPKNLLQGMEAPMHVKLCAFTKKDGTPCRAVAITGRSHCIFHQPSRRQQRIRTTPAMHLDSLEDRHSILMAMSGVINAAVSGFVGPKRAATLLERIRHANDSLARRERPEEIEEIYREPQTNWIQ